MPTDYTLGWDVVVATRQKEVNEGVQKAYAAGLLPKGFDVSINIQILGVSIPCRMQGTFGPMTVSGGNGQSVVVGLPIQSGTISGPAGFSAPLDGIQANVTVALQLIQSPVQPADGTDYDLNVHLGQNTFQGIELANLPPILSGQATALGIALTNWLNQTTSNNTYTIATVNLNALKSQYPYFVPNLADYATLTADTPDDNVFAVLLRTVSPNVGGLNLLPETIPDGQRASLLINNDLFMRHVLMQALVSSFGTSPSNLAATTASVGGVNVTTITNANQFSLPNVSHNPTITSLSVGISNGYLGISLGASADVSPGISVSYSANGTYSLTPGASSGGTQSLALTQVTFTQSHETNIAWWVWTLAAATIVVAGPIIAGIAVAIVAVIQAIVNSVAGNVSIGNLIAAARPVQWSYANVLDVKAADMPTPVRLSGTLPIVQ